MTFSFTIPGRLAGNNELRYADRSHWSKGAKLRREELQMIWPIILKAKSEQSAYFKGAVGVNFDWIEPNEKRDPDNVIGGSKVILDALVKIGVIEADTRRVIKKLIHYFGLTDKKDPRINVWV